MAATSIDELIKTVQTVKVLEKALREHDTLIKAVVGRLDQIEQRLAALEPGTPPSPRLS